MITILSKLFVGVRAVSALITVFLFLLTAASFGNQPDALIDNGRDKNETIYPSSIVLASGDGLSYGMTKKEAYDVKGVPEKINRMAGEEGKEMWVYRCQNDDGYDEDCLYLYFDGDELVKIERL